MSKNFNVFFGLPPPRAKFITKIITLLPAGVNCEKSVNFCSPSTLKSTLNIVSSSIAVKYLQIHYLCVFELALISVSTKNDCDLILSLL